jgi:hypothetical protein
MGGPLVIEEKIMIGEKPKNKLIKAMNSKYAKQLMDNGTIRLWLKEHFTPIEGSQGDGLEGKSCTIRNGMKVYLRPANQVFICCASESYENDNDNEKLKKKLIGIDNTFDEIVQIDNLDEFIHRIGKTRREKDIGFIGSQKEIFGIVNYDFGESDYNQRFGDDFGNMINCVFQKRKSWEWQREFRIALEYIPNQPPNQQRVRYYINDCRPGCNSQNISENYCLHCMDCFIHLSIGPCGDIISIVSS